LFNHVGIVIVIVMATPEAGTCSTSNAEIIFPVMDKIKNRSPDFSDAMEPGKWKEGNRLNEGTWTKGDGPFRRNEGRKRGTKGEEGNEG
jgi:hypothetical protein